MPIIRKGHLVEDDWRHLADEDGVPANGAVTVSLKRFNAEREALLARKAPLGIRLKSEERAHAIGKDAVHFALIAVELSVFRDGRAFSAARLLRERYGYKGEIRARGHILPDQALFLARCGVNTFEPNGNVAFDPFVRAFAEYSVTYQNMRSANGTAPALRMRAPALGLAQAAE